MQNIIGTPARGEDFYKRPREVDKIEKGIKAGMHMQIAAPRRVGKTSILQYFKDNPIEGFYFVFVDVESIDNENDFYRKLLVELLRSEAFSTSQKIVEQLKGKANRFLSRLRTVRVLGTELGLSESDSVDYYIEFENLIKGINLEGKKIVIMIDEFPETILNIFSQSNESMDKVLDFLKSNRSLRQDSEISDKIVFIYTGSIGLNHTVSKFDATHTINDLDSVGISQLKKEEATDLINQILNKEGYIIDEAISDYIISEVEWLIPFHIKLILKEIMILINPGEVIAQKVVDTAFDQIIEYRNNSYFEHYKTRLRRTFKEADEHKYALDVLQYVVENSTIESPKLYDLAVPYNLNASYKNVIETLVYDGYINNNEDNKIYQFNSPIIKKWWKRYVSN